MDFVEICEELGAAYGVIPMTIAQLPWLQVKTLWDAFQKRQRRTMKYDAQLHAMSMGGMLGGGLGTTPAAGNPGDNLNRLAALGASISVERK